MAIYNVVVHVHILCKHYYNCASCIRLFQLSGHMQVPKCLDNWGSTVLSYKSLVLTLGSVTGTTSTVTSFNWWVIFFDGITSSSNCTPILHMGSNWHNYTNICDKLESWLTCLPNYLTFYGNLSRARLLSHAKSWGVIFFDIYIVLCYWYERGCCEVDLKR